MKERWSLLVLTLIAGHVRSQSQLEYNITTTWNGADINHDPIQLTLSGSSDGEYLELGIEAPFFNDPPAPPGPAGQPFYGLWNYEVVEAFFLNDDNQYVEVEVCPWGQHIVLLLDGKRITVRHSLALEVNTTRMGEKWTGSARIPVGYLPKNVTKFNAYGIHGSGESRVYESLFPAPGDAIAPDFHALEYFSEIDLSEILPEQSSAEMSELWTDSLEGIFRYRIQTNWNGVPVDHPSAEIVLQGFTAGVEMNITAPFFNDPAPPNGEPGKPYYGLWDYEVVEMFFLNDDNEYLEVELGPWGEHLLLMLKGARHVIKHSLALDYVVERDEAAGTWKGSAMIPPDYFPPKVNRMNAYAIHGVDDEREYESLYPAPFEDPDYPTPDFHRLELFRPIDFEFQLADNSEYSDLWNETIHSGSGSTTALPTVRDADEDIRAVTILEDMEAVTVLDDLGAVTVLGPAEAAFQPTSAPAQLPHSQGTTGVVFQPTPTAVQQPHIHSSAANGLPILKKEAIPRVPRPQLLVPDETRKQREEDAPSFFGSPASSGHEPQVPQPIRLGNRRKSPTDRQSVERSPVRASVGFQGQGQSQSEQVAPESIQIRNQRPFIQNQNQRPFTQNQNQRPLRRRPSQTINGNLPHVEAQFSSNRSPFQPQDQTSASSQFQAQGQVFRAPDENERNPAFAIQQEPGFQFQGQPFINQEIRQPPRPNLLQEDSLFHDQRQPLLQNQGLPPFRNQEQQFQQPGQTQFFNNERPLLQTPGEPQFPNHGQQQFQNQGQAHFQNPGAPHFQNPGAPHFQNSVQPQFENNVQTQFSNQGHSQFQNNERLPFQSDPSPSTTASEGHGGFGHHDQGQSPVQFSETGQPEESNPTELPVSQTEDQNFQGHQSFEVPGSVSSVVQPPRSLGLEETLTPEVQGVLHTLSSETPALPPPHPVCFEQGLVADPDQCFVFHECILEGGEWQMYSWRCRRGQIYDSESVACIRGRCPRRGQTRRRVRGHSSHFSQYKK